MEKRSQSLNRFSGEANEYFFTSERPIQAFKFPLGHTLLKVMETLPLLDIETKYITDSNFIEQFIETVENFYSQSENEKNFFENILKHFYMDDLSLFTEKSLFSELLVGTAGDYYSDLLNGIHTYIKLCMKRPEFYNYNCFLKLSCLVSAGFSLPHVDVSMVSCQLHISDMEYFFENNSSKFHTNSHNFKDLISLCLASLYELIMSDLKIKECTHCGKWFVEYSKNEKYCSDRCKDEGRKLKEKARVSEGSAYLLRELRQMFYTSKLFDERNAFNDEVDKWRRRIADGDAKENDFILWLISNFKTEKKRKELLNKWQPS